MCHCEDAHVETALLQHHGAWSSGSGSGSYLFERVPWQSLLPVDTQHTVTGAWAWPVAKLLRACCREAWSVHVSV